MVCGHHLHNHCLMEIVLLLASPFDLLVTFAHQQVKLKLNRSTSKRLMDLELHCDYFFLFLAQCMRYTIPFHTIKVCFFFFFLRWWLFCVFLSMFSTAVDVMVLGGSFKLLKRCRYCCFSWVQSFGHEGLGLLMDILEKLLLKKQLSFSCTDLYVQSFAFFYVTSTQF